MEPFYIWRTHIEEAQHSISIMENSPRIPLELFDTPMSKRCRVIMITFGSEDVLFVCLRWAPWFARLVVRLLPALFCRVLGYCCFVLLMVIK
jgi:hypothetical protein